MNLVLNEHCELCPLDGHQNCVHEHIVVIRGPTTEYFFSTMYFLHDYW